MSWNSTFDAVGVPRTRLTTLLCIGLLIALLAAGQAAAPAYASGKVWHVAPAGLTSGPCNTWLTFCDLQHSLSGAASGDSLWVKQGTYLPTMTTNRSASFALKNGVKIYGGFAGTETLLSQRNPKTHVTILSGDIGTGGDASDNVYHVVTATGTSATALLDGFTITGGNANGTSPNDSGGGIYNPDGAPTLTDLIVTGNGANTGAGMFNGTGSAHLTAVAFSNNIAGPGGGGYGGGMANGSGAPALSKVTFSNNTAPFGYGGGISNAGNLTLTDATLSGNAAGYGGGMYSTGSSHPTLNRVTFKGNGAGLGGSAVMSDSGSPMLTNVTITGNTGGGGGAIYNVGSNLTLKNVTVSGNSGSGFGGISNQSGNSTIYDSIFWNSGTEFDVASGIVMIYDSDIHGGCPANAGCTHVLKSNPHLGALKNNGGYTKTMALGAGSPAINSGGQNSTCAATDQRGVKRPQGPACDMGAYEAPVTVTFRSSAAQDGWIMDRTEGSVMNSGGPSVFLGDTTSWYQYRSILSFSTASLPDNAVISSIKIKLRQKSVNPPLTDPISLLHGISVDLRTGFFGAGAGLELTDFGSAASKTVGPFFPALSGGYYTMSLASGTFAYVNKLATKGGVTQVRLRFALHDNHDAINNYLEVFSGNSGTAANRPQLIIVYTTP